METLLNQIFISKNSNSHTYAKHILEILCQNLDRGNDMCVAQLYFVIGHVAIKKLVIIEQIENQIHEEIQTQPGEVDDLAQVTGGADEIIRQYRGKLR